MTGTEGDVVQQVERAIEQLTAAKAEVGRVILGQGDVVEQSIITLLSGGHGLLVGMPGLAKTRLVETLATVMGLAQKRVQFTPDLMPADILGSEVLEEGEDGRRHFRFIDGPIFCQLLMADEINRASPRTQAALLQAMQEHRVTVAGADRPLPEPFHVLATQNPIEQEGTYPLPEAQLDRFLLEIDVDYPDLAAERQMVINTTGTSEDQASPVLDGPTLQGLQSLVRSMTDGEQLVDLIVDVVRSARPQGSADDVVREQLAWGPGPRASQALMLTVRARALLDGRFAPSVDDVRAMAFPVLKHRMALSFAARAEGLKIANVIDRVVRRALGE